MTFLLDTNVISEFSRHRPASQVVGWVRGIDFRQTYLSVVTVAEVRRGIVSAKDPLQRTKLVDWFEGNILPLYRDLVLPMDVEVAEVTGQIIGGCDQRGRPIEHFDAVIAATAQVHNLTLVTRNTKDFEAWGGPVFDPWA